MLHFENMKFQAKVTDVTKIEADMLVVFAGSEEAKKVDGAEEFDGEQGDILLLHSYGNIPAKRVAIVGLGKLTELTIADLQTIGAKIGRKAKEVAAKTVAIAFPKELQAQAIVEGLILGTYTFSKHKSEETRNKEKHIEEVIFLTTPPKLNAVVDGISRGETVSKAVTFARDLVNEPPSVTTPTHLAETARKLVKGNSGMSCEVFTPVEMKKLGMEAILGIARGSDEEPRFIVLKYRGGGKTVCLVGKGITFDTGGLSLKDSKNMETMKLDMAGAAAILGVFSVLPLLQPKVNIVGLIAATENMPGPKAVKPGDIVRAMNGKTIEILNTDAEGRVVLADALSYAGAKVNADAIVDLATLTGACMVALGEEIAGMFTDDETLAKDLKRSAVASGENIWAMPLSKEYKELLKSDVADLRNISGSKYGGAINAALFLREFAPVGIPWAHLDIAGPAFAEKDAPLTPKGGTGFGVRMILSYLLSQ